MFITKQSSMEVKESVQWLCNCLNQHGFSSIEPETLRQGKFNRDEAVPALWRLLGELIFCIQKGKLDATVKSEVENTLKDKSSFEVVKNAVINLGYLTSDFAKFQNDNIKSREILLAIGWIIAVHQPIDMLTEVCIKNSSISQEDSFNFHQEVLMPVEKSSTYLLSGMSESEAAQHLMWNLGHLNLSLKSLLSSQHKRLSLLNKVHQKTTGICLSPDSPHLSMLQTTIISHAKLFTKYLEHLEAESRMLTSYLNWKEGESLFWKWMESIADLKKQEQLAERNNNIAAAEVESDNQNSACKTPFKMNFSDCLQKPRSPVPHHGVRFIYQTEQFSGVQKSSNHEKLSKLQEKLESHLVKMKKDLQCSQTECRTILENCLLTSPTLSCIPP